jgi:TRAP-type C4-dicarboxylate transport system substrate-binding protein
MKIPFAAALAAFAALSAPAAAQEVTLKLTTLANPDFTGNTQVLHPWAARVNEQGKGVLKIDVIDGLSVANHGNYYDRLMNDVVQISFGTTSTVAGKFRKTNVVGLPFLTDDSEVAGVALWRLYKSGMLDDEFDQIVPASMFVFPQVMPHYRVEPRTIENFNGLKVIASGKILGEVITALGGAPVTMPIFEQYPSLQRGVADATMANYSSFEPYKLAEVTKFHVETALGTTPGYIAVNKARYLALPEAARKVLDANSTEKETRTYGQYWNRGQQRGQALVADRTVHKVVKLPDDIARVWAQKIAPIESQWVADTPNGAAVLAKYRELVKQVAAGM